MSKLVSVILTGGKSSRMGYENKSFLKIKDKYFIEILIESLQGKSNDIIINANRDISKYKIFGYKVGELPITEKISKTLLRLPFYTSISKNQQDRVIRLLLGYNFLN